MCQDEHDRAFVNNLSHFLVSLGCVSRSPLVMPNSEQTFFTSGFVIELEDLAYLVTAGHVFGQIRDRLNSLQRWTHNFFLQAGLGTFSLNRHAIAFNFRNPVFSTHRHEGLDFGAIRLSPLERTMLTSNGILTVEERVWNQELPTQFSEFALLGLPRQNMDLRTPGLPIIQPVFIRVEAMTSTPSEYLHHTDQMRYFRVMEPSRSDLDIEGMSGCPVFAFRQHDELGVQAIVCAIQSTWLPRQRILATCDLRFAGNILREAMRSQVSGAGGMPAL